MDYFDDMLLDTLRALASNHPEVQLARAIRDEARAKNNNQCPDKFYKDVWRAEEKVAKRLLTKLAEVYGE